MDLPNFNRILVLSVLLMTVAGTAVVSGRRVRDRLLAIAILVQGVVMLMVAVSSYFPQPGVELAAAGLCVLVPLWMIHLSGNARCQPVALPDGEPASTSDPTPLDAPSQTSDTDGASE